MQFILIHDQNNFAISMIKLLLFAALVASLQCEETIAVIGTNDIHGSAFPTSLMREDTGQKYNYGGLPIMGRLIEILKNENPNKVMYLDAGDQFQGGIEASSLISSGEIINDFFNIIDVNGSAIGNHEFDFGPDFLMPYLQGRSSPNLAANLKSETGESNFLPHQKASKLFSFSNGIKIGVIGLATIETPSTTAGFLDGLFPPYKFMAYKNFVTSESTKLKKSGANAVLILSHVGDACPLDLTYGIWTSQTPQSQCPDDEISNLISSLPEGTVHGVVQGHRHSAVHQYRKNVPYMGNINGGFYFNVLYLTFNDRKEVVGSRIEGPIPVCEKVFENLGRCNYVPEEELGGAGQLISWRFHNQDVYPHEVIQDVYDRKWLPLMQPYLVDIVQNQITMGKERLKESELGNLVSDIFCAATEDCDFAIVNPGMFRTQWVPGIIQYQHFYNMFPFENRIQSFAISGSELLQMLEIIQSGTKGFYQSAKLQMEVELKDNVKKFLSAKFLDQTEIDSDRQYRGVTVDFLLNGGDDFKNVINKVYTPRGVSDEGDVKKVLQPRLKEMEIIRKGSLIDPDHPRLIVH